jgi:hypothetical protein
MHTQSQTFIKYSLYGTLGRYWMWYNKSRLIWSQEVVLVEVVIVRVSRHANS